MADKMERRFPGHGEREIFDKLVVRLTEIATHYGLKVESDPQSLSGRVHRTGANVKFDVKGDALHMLFDFGMLIPKPIRERVKDEIGKRLETLF